MPVPGAMGAIAGATRRRRQGTSMSYKPSIPGVSKQCALRSSLDSAPRTAESNQSMMTRLKQQAQETGVFLKKRQQAFSQQLQKGIKIATSLKPGQKKENLLQHSQPAPVATNGQSDEQMGEWIAALSQMGFEKAHICEAARMLGGHPEHLDDLLQVVVAIAASEDGESRGGASWGGASSSGMPSSSSIAEARPSDSEPLCVIDISEPSKDKAGVDDFVDLLFRMKDVEQGSMHTPMDTSTGSVDILYDVSGYESEEDQRNVSVPDLAPVEPSSKDLAAVIVASAIDKALSKVPDALIVTKQIGEHPSPVRGGA